MLAKMHHNAALGGRYSAAKWKVFVAYRILLGGIFIGNKGLTLLVITWKESTLFQVTSH